MNEVKTRKGIKHSGDADVGKGEEVKRGKINRVRSETDVPQAD